MFKFIDKDVFGDNAAYHFEILDYSTYDVVGKVMILVGPIRHDAAVVFNRDKIGPITAYPYLEDLRELLDADLFPIDEPHSRIIISEIVYENSRYRF